MEAVSATAMIVMMTGAPVDTDDVTTTAAEATVAVAMGTARIAVTVVTAMIMAHHAESTVMRLAMTAITTVGMIDVEVEAVATMTDPRRLLQAVPEDTTTLLPARSHMAVAGSMMIVVSISTVLPCGSITEHPTA